MHILIIDDETEVAYTIKRALKKKEYSIKSIQDPEIIMDNPEYAGEFGLILLDINMPKIDGLTLLKEIKRVAPQIPVIIITAFGSENIAVQAIKAGASDYLKKPFTIKELRDICEKYLSCINDQIYKDEFPEIITNSKKMYSILKLLKKVKDIDVTVLITGESGTGKELIARSIHNAWSKSEEPFIPINCGAIPENLIESELFGFEKGSFTGAICTQRGKFEIAGSGSIFLDEIGELPIALQPKLLRVLQEKNFMRIGGNSFLPVKCRIITATHQDLEKEVKASNFREDLFFRLNIVRIDLPPLRERKEDIVLLANHFIKYFNKKYGFSWIGIDEDASDLLTNYSFPGNIRELRNIIERIMVTADGNIINKTHIKKIYGIENTLRYKDMLERDYHDLKREVINNFERQYFTRLMSTFNGNISNASKHSGLPRKTIYEKLKEHNIEQQNYRNQK